MPLYEVSKLEILRKIISLHKSYLVTHGKFFEFGLVSDGKLVNSPQCDDIWSHLTAVRPTKKVTKSPKNRYPMYVECT